MNITYKEVEVEKVVKVKEKVISIELSEKDAYALHALLGEQSIEEWSCAMDNSSNRDKLKKLFPVPRNWTSIGYLENIWNKLNTILPHS